jgi:hypothetical protein
LTTSPQKWDRQLFPEGFSPASSSKPISLISRRKTPKTSIPENASSVSLDDLSSKKLIKRIYPVPFL